MSFLKNYDTTIMHSDEIIKLGFLPLISFRDEVILDEETEL